ncbi:hypothetical protein DY000_02007095 [Brassica cretica]|uniref:Uncharacterized protein n=1 Tax=Brassica cretica TaxID=69181 RepID=A0ABQ7CDK9_BRACR|nr:hypothetical protein DY000_02007095 [Brassica cretica]
METGISMAMDRRVTSTRVRSTRNPTARTTAPITAGVMETLLTRSHHHRLKRARLKQCLIGFVGVKIGHDGINV